MNPKRVADLTVLLEEKAIAYYWIGFLMADGHFYKHGAIKLHLAKRDTCHVKKYGEFIRYIGKAKPNTINVMNPFVVREICNKFKVSNRKTLEPCDLSRIISDDLLFSLFIGFFDGDGTINKRKQKVRSAAIKTHRSWLFNLKLFERFIYKIFPKKRKYDTNLARLNGCGYAILMLSDLSMLAAIKRKAQELCLPFMERKWNHVDENWVSDYEIKFLKICDWIKRGIHIEVIAKNLGIKKKSLKVYMRKKNIKWQLS